MVLERRPVGWVPPLVGGLWWACSSIGIQEQGIGIQFDLGFDTVHSVMQQDQDFQRHAESVRACSGGDLTLQQSDGERGPDDDEQKPASAQPRLRREPPPALPAGRMLGDSSGPGRWGEGSGLPGRLPSTEACTEFDRSLEAMAVNDTNESRSTHPVALFVCLATVQTLVPHTNTACIQAAH